MNQVLEEILKTGYSLSPEGDLIKIHSHIDRREIKLLRQLIQKHRPVVSLEIGLAYGVSALTICDALTEPSQCRHIIIDPHQNRKPVWGGIGLYNLNRAGFGELIEFYEMPSYRALPLLESRNERIDFAFIDGWHTFDYTLVDFFYIDKMLKVGGIVAFDDADWPAIRSVCRFITTNLNYSVYNLQKEFLMDEEDLSQNKRDPLKPYLHTVIHHLSKLLHPAWGNSDKSFILSKDISLGLRGNFVVFIKEAEDSRKWSHFIPF